MLLLRRGGEGVGRQDERQATPRILNPQHRQRRRRMRLIFHSFTFDYHRTDTERTNLGAEDGMVMGSSSSRNLCLSAEAARFTTLWIRTFVLFKIERCCCGSFFFLTRQQIEEFVSQIRGILGRKLTLVDK